MALLPLLLFLLKAGAFLRPAEDPFLFIVEHRVGVDVFYVVLIQFLIPLLFLIQLLHQLTVLVRTLPDKLRQSCDFNFFLLVIGFHKL